MLDSTELEITRPFPGLTRRILSCTADSMLVEHHMEPDSIFPWHSHVHEQTVFVLEGNLEVWTRSAPEAPERLRTAKAGDSWVVPSNVEHRVRALTVARVLDFFTPYREDYLPPGHPLEIRR